MKYALGSLLTMMVLVSSSVGALSGERAGSEWRLTRLADKTYTHRSLVAPVGAGVPGDGARVLTRNHRHAKYPK